MNKIIKHIKSEINELGNLKSNFIISNLLKGQGLTIGNSLRRILLSNINGTAIIAIKIPGISSEFTTIPGIREDVLEILLNLKEVILKNIYNKSNKIYYGKITLYGPGIITAKSIKFPFPIKIINPNHYIATVYKKQKISFDLIAITTSGYMFQKNIKFYYPNFLNIDAIFLPIIKVNYSIFDDFLYTNEKEALLIEIVTNGSLSPNTALLFSSKILKNIYFDIEKIIK